MNKHILLVMKWLDNKDSVSQDELEENKREAWAVWAANAANANAADVDWAADVAWAADAADATAAANYWIDEYFIETSEDKNEYLKELSK